MELPVTASAGKESQGAVHHANKEFEETSYLLLLKEVQMNNVQKLTEKLHKVYLKFGVDARDIEMLAFLSSWWDKSKSTRVMDIVKATNIASPSTVLHILKDLEFVGLINIHNSVDDAREKYIVAGNKFAALNRALEGV